MNGENNTAPVRTLFDTHSPSSISVSLSQINTPMSPIQSTTVPFRKSHLWRDEFSYPGIDGLGELGVPTSSKQQVNTIPTGLETGLGPIRSLAVGTQPLDE